MIIKGRRRGGAKNLSDHLRRTDENEQVKFHDLEGFALDQLTGPGLEIALKQMEAIGYAKNDKRNLYHAILAPAYGETLNAKQCDFMVNYYLEHMGFKGHQYALVEHWKKGKQHFHLVVNIINPESGKTHELNWTKQKEWRISRGLEEVLGLSTPTPKGKAQPTWAMQRAKRTGIDPRKMRKEVTAIFHASKTPKQFITALDKAGYGVTKGNRGQLVLVDSKGDTHGLMRMIEGQKVADLRRKFPGIDKLPYPPHANMVKARQETGAQEISGKPIDAKFVKGAINAAMQNSKTGAEFVALMNKQQYSFGRTIKGFTLIDKNGGKHDLNAMLGKSATKDLYQKFPDLAAIKPSPVMELVRRMRSGKPSRVTRHPLRRAAFHFGRAARSFSRPSFQPASFKPVIFGSITGLMMKLAAIGRRNAAKDEAEKKAQQNRFPIIRRRRPRKVENKLAKGGPTRVEIENAELLRWAWENHRIDILAQFGIYVLPDNPTLSELVQHGLIPPDALEP
jgi:hypothetical protein